MQITAAGAVIIPGIIVIYLICLLVSRKVRLISRSYNREKDKLLRHQIADSLEEAAPIHLDIGNNNEGELSGGSVLAAAAATETVSAQMAFADEAWLITASDGMSAALEKDAVRNGMTMADYGNAYDPDCAVFSGTSPIEHGAGNCVVQETAPSALHLSMGAGGTACALSDVLYQKGEVICVSGDDLLSQAVGTVSADAVFVGEQVFEIPDSLDREEKKNAALMTMDVIRWLVIAAAAAFIAAGLSGL